MPWQIGACTVLFVIGSLASTRVARALGRKDPGLIVVDEIVGMWITLVGLPFTPAIALAGFVLFRVMDVLKPWPARSLENVPEGGGSWPTTSPPASTPTSCCGWPCSSGPYSDRGVPPGAPGGGRGPEGGARSMRAELVAVGSELLGPLRADTNTLWITERLLEAGVEVAVRDTVADDPELLESVLRGALSRADLVVTTGGLGPTEDDLTREAAAAALGRRLVRDPEIVESLRVRFASFGRVMPSTNEKQGDLIEGARALENRRGTAPGQRVEHRGGGSSCSCRGRPTR